MKKDIEWLKAWFDDGKSYPGGYVKFKINQLDELEVLSQEWIDEHSVAVTYDGIPDQTEIVYVDELENLIAPKQELPVVPKWFDEWWKDVTKGGGNLFHNIKRFYNELFSAGTRETYNYISYTDNKKKLLNIIINELDYVLEEEQKYYALVKGHELIADEGGSTYKHWKFDTSNDGVFVSKLYSIHDNFLIKMSKSEWNKLGINESNADFVKVEEMEE